MLLTNILLLANLFAAQADSVGSNTQFDNYYKDSIKIETTHQQDSITEKTEVRKYPWRATAQVVGANLGILAFDRYILDAPFSKVTWRTIGRNLSPTKWYWDSDIFRTNLFSHPYHGSIYYNAARGNGLSYVEAIPYTIIGSLMWEIGGEMERPSINDFLATSIGGLPTGEVLHRVSDRIFDNRKRGFERVVREIIGTVVNPSQGFTRLITGTAFRTTNIRSNLETDNSIPLYFSILSSAQMLDSHTAGVKPNYRPAFDISFSYGSPVNAANKRPYDFFRANLGLSPGMKQSFVSNASIIGQLRQWPLLQTNNSTTTVGLYQNFDFYSTDSIKGTVPYKVSEAASMGVGIAWYYELRRLKCFSELYLNGVLLGGALSDYQNNRYKRDYSVGSGYSIKNYSGIDYGSLVHFRLLADMKYLASWHSYEDEDETKEYVDYSVMGDRGRVITFLLQPKIEISLSKHWFMAAPLLFVFRNFHYRYRRNRHTTTYDVRLGIGFRL
ncbi:DUF3943 domain-containing protein [Prevotella falsenii]|uniref:DUF3943 domain-containing protein n=1 Tax=Prevotella falsenii TaxID=515414 RepID=UPI0004695E0B|nr:DUF3943 domain-containing protein [Prevotella falsenii]